MKCLYILSYLLCSFILNTRAQTITTFAGNGVAGFGGDGGPATTAAINLIYSVAIDAVGNAYIADTWNHRIRKVDPTGVITTIAGTGTPAYSGDAGPALLANINTPTGVTLDASGNIYICDQNNHRVRKISTSGIITTIAGNGVLGFSGDGGAATLARLHLPTGLVVDPAGNVYIADQYNHRVRMVTPAGIITTYAGSGVSGFGGDGGPAIAGRLNLPCGVAIDAAGNIYITDYSNHRIRKVTTAGIITTHAGDGIAGFLGDGGPATAARLNRPWGIVSDGPGNIYIGDYGNNRVRKVDVAGIITTYAGNGTVGFSGDGGPATLAVLRNPAGLCLDCLNNLYFADQGNSRIRKVGSATTTLPPITGPSTVCEGSTITLSNTATGGTWSSGATAIATIGSATGIVLGIAAGTATITYTVGPCAITTTTITVNALPGVHGMTGGGSYCSGGVGLSIGLSGSDAGISYQLYLGAATSGIPVPGTGAALGFGLHTLPGIYTVVAVNSVTGCAANMAGSSTITVLANDTTYSSMDTGVCLTAGLVMLTAPPGYATYNWSTGSTASFIFVSSSGTWYVTSSNGCSLAVDTFNVTFLTVPVVALGNDTAFCTGDVLTLSSPQPPGSTWLWSTGSTSNPIIASVTGLYKLTVTNSDGCVAADSVNVTISPLPVVSLGPDTAICNGLTPTLLSAVSYPAGAIYLWSTGATTSSIVAPLIGTYWLRVTVTGCAGTDTMVLLNIYDTLNFQMTDTAICRGNKINVRAAGTPGMVYQWRPTTGIPVSTIAPAVITPDTSAMYYLTASISTCPDIVDSFYIDVQPFPVVSLDGSTAVCRFDTIRLHALVTPAWYANYAYSWSPGINLDDSAKSTVIFSPGDSVKMTVTVTTPAGCSGNDSALLVVYPQNLTSLDTLIRLCPHDSATLMPVLVDPGTTFKWHPALYLDDSLSPQPKVKPITSQAYWAVTTNTYGCRDTIHAGIVVSPGAQVDAGDSVTIYPGQAYQVPTQTNCVSFSWFPAAGLNNASLSAPIASPQISTKYIVHAVSEWGCKTSDSVSIYVSEGSLIEIPNAFAPGSGSNGTFKLIKRGVAMLSSFEIFNRWGNLVFESKNIDEGWDGTYKGTPQPFGVYVYKVEAVTNTGKVFSKKGNVTLVR